MRRWFDSLPIHRKLVTLALAVTTAALLVATVGLVALDFWVYRAEAIRETDSLARILAENSAAAVVFEDREAARETVESARSRTVIRRACIYLADTTLFTGFTQTPAEPCPATLPGPGRLTSSSVVRTSPIVTSGAVVGTIYVDRALSDVTTRVLLTTSAGAGMLLLAGGLALLLANRVHRYVSTPITQLASAARTIGRAPGGELPEIAGSTDEFGDLARAFTEMAARVRESNDRLTTSNEALLREVEERRCVEAEREQLLVREREANRLKDEFLAAVSHELRTPLNAISGWTQVLARSRADADTSEKAIDSITRNIRVQARVIEDLVDISRIATGKLHVASEVLDLRVPIDTANETLAAAARAKSLDLRTSMPDTPCLVRGDPDRLEQVVRNLVSNAIKFTPDGGGVSLTLAAVNGEYEVRITDTGTGIPADFLPHVFERFRQADGSLTREHGGLGLGLAIVKELTELHGGSIAVTSGGPGRGATFTLRLPRLADGPLISTAPRDAGTMPSLTGLAVVIVDDDADSLEVLRTTLTGVGAAVRAVGTGLEAVRQWEREPGDVLLCDLAMPQMDGFEVLRRVRELDALRGRATRAIAISAHASEPHRAESLSAGFRAHVSKPFTTGDLIRAVAAAAAAL